MKAHIISLGCAKNLTDTEVIMGKLVASGYSLTNNPSQADIIIINTCAFLKSARDEAKAVIKEMEKYKKEIYLAGCLPKYLERNRDVQPCLPAGRSQVPKLNTIDSIQLYNCNEPRIKATPPWFAYVKIAEGCNNCCSYCLIPKIRGKLRSRSVSDVINEVKWLAKRKVKEIIFVAQDTTAHAKFADIIRKTAKVKGIEWIRIMYTHPSHITDKLINIMAQEKKVVPYLDLPIQHACDRILHLMKRRYTRIGLEKLISKIRRKIPNITLRTSVIVGFPGEGKTEFEELYAFIKQVKFERLGVFTFSKEKGTPAAKLGGQVSEKVKQTRFDKLMRLAKRISKEKNKNMVGKTLKTIIENKNSGRTLSDAPDIDGKVHIKAAKSISPGEIVKVRVTKAGTYDLYGEVV